MKLSFYHKQDDCEQKLITLSRLFAINLKNVGPTFFKITQIAVRFNPVHLCRSMLLFPFAVFLLCCSTVLRGYCNVSLYFLGILGVKKLHHSFCVP